MELDASCRTQLVVLALLLLLCCQIGEAIDCFKCVSRNGDFPACDDPFHNNYTSEILESPCMGGRKGRDGLFPATACIKLSGKYVSNGTRITVRGCALDSGGITVDTEIIRMSHCGAFYYDTVYVRGCLQSCDDADACNATPPRRQASVFALAFALTCRLGVAASTSASAWR